MTARTDGQPVDHSRRAFLGGAAVGIGAAGIAGVLPAYRTAMAADEVIRPFRISVPEADQSQVWERAGEELPS